MNKAINILVLTFLITFFCIDAHAVPLQGGVNTSHELPPISHKLRTGAIFNEANLPPMGTTQEWRKIPSWAAGMWHRETQTNFLPTGTVTTLSRTLDEHQAGEQADRNGGIWKHISLPEKCTVELDQYIEYQIVTDSEPILTNGSHTVGRLRVTAIKIKKLNNRIVKVFQREEFDIRHPEEQGVIFQDGLITVYNEHGKPLYTQHAQCHYYQIRPFAPINIDPKTGLDLHQDFKNYLMSHGLANLVPIDEPAQVSKTQATTY